MDSAADVLNGLVTLGAAAAVVLLVALVAANFPLTFLTVALFAFVLVNYRYDPTGDTSGGLELAGTQWYPMDVVFVVSVVSSMWLFLSGNARFAGLRRSRVWLVVLTALVGTGLLTSILGLGLAAGVNSWRYWLYSMGLLWWSVAASGRMGNRAMRPILMAGVFAACVQLHGFVTAGFGSASSNVLIDGYYVDVRPIHATAALLMTAGLLALLATPVRSRTTQVLLVAFLLGSIAASQQRTVWVATAVGLLALLALRHHSGRALAPLALGLAALGVVAIAIWNPVTTDAFGESATSSETFEYRVELWQERIEVLNGGRAISGTAFSPLGPEETVRGTMSNHSMALDTIYAVGAIGLVCVIVIWIAAWKNTPVVRPILVSIAAFGISYAWPIWAWVVIGIGIASTMKSKGNSSRPSPPNPISVPGNSLNYAVD